MLLVMALCVCEWSVFKTIILPTLRATNPTYFERAIALRRGGAICLRKPVIPSANE